MKKTYNQWLIEPELTNQELLKKLERKIPEFTEAELANLFELIMVNMSLTYREKALKNIEKISPQFHHSMQKTIQQLEQEKTDQQVDRIKKALEKK